MNAASVLLALMLSVDPQLPADAPVAVLAEGQPAPFDGVLLTNAGAIATAKRLTSAEAQVAEYEAHDAHWSPTLVIALVASALATGIVATYGACSASKACR